MSTGRDSVAVITDIHGNLPAPQAALARIDELGIESVLCCGDLVGYGPHPNEVCALIAEREIPAVARELGKPCVVDATGVDIDLDRHRVRIGGHEFAEGDEISIDGESGRVFAGAVRIEEERPTAYVAIVAGWQTA